MHPFAYYLQTHCIEPLALAKFARVRYLTVWSAMQGKPTQHTHAAQLLQAARILSGARYTGLLNLCPGSSHEQADMAPVIQVGHAQGVGILARLVMEKKGR